MAQVFICHVEEDQELAQGLAERMEAEGISTWYYERDSHPGTSYLTQTRKAISECSAVLILLSRAAFDNPPQMEREIFQAFSEQKQFFPILVGVSIERFKSRQPDWHSMTGAATAVRVPRGGASELMPRLLLGFKEAGLWSRPLPDGPIPPRPRLRDRLIRSLPRWAWLALGFVVLGGGIVAAALVIGAGESGSTTGSTETNPTSARHRAFEKVAEVDGRPSFVEFGFGAVWVVSDDGPQGVLSRIEPGGGPVERIEVGSRPIRMTFRGTDAEGSVWTANQGENTVSRVDVPLSDAPPAEYQVGIRPTGIQSPREKPFVWVANGGGDSLSRIDSEIESLEEAVIDVPVGSRPTSMSATPTTVVTADMGDGTASFVAVDAPQKIGDVPVGSSPAYVGRVPAEGERPTYLWVASVDEGKGKIYVVDPRVRSVVKEIRMRSQPAFLIYDHAGSVWTMNLRDASLYRVNVDTFEVSEVSVGSQPIALTLTKDAAWAAVYGEILVRISLNDETPTEFKMGCPAAHINAPWPEPDTYGPELQGVWVACEDGSILHIDAAA